VARAAFIVLQVITALASLVGFMASLAGILLEGLFGLAKGGFGVIAAVVTLFASGFKDSAPPPEPSFAIEPILIFLAILFFAMLTSAFTPSAKIFLHVVAAGVVVVGLWRIWIIATVPNSPVLFLPILAMWLVYYGFSLRRG
jgi:hypothetical protein